MKLRSIRELIYWEYAKLIAEKTAGSRRDFAEVTRVWKRLKSGEIAMSSLLRENKLLVQAEHLCAYCGAREGLQWEHIVPRSRGGPDSPSLPRARTTRS